MMTSLRLLCVFALLATCALSDETDKTDEMDETGRCRNLEYDPAREQCCGGVIYDRREYDSCCGDTIPYMFAAWLPAISGCCDGVPYTVYEQYCCRGKKLFSVYDPYASDCLPVL